jgi:aminopeptidase N
VFCPVFAFGTKEEWNFGFERLSHLSSSKSTADRTFLLKTLAGCPRDPAKIEKCVFFNGLEINFSFLNI